MKAERDLGVRPYQSIEDIRFMREIEEGPEYGPLDPKIANLVRVLNPLGLYTMGSCQGHMNRGWRYPWITIWAVHYYIESRRAMHDMLEPFNFKSPVKWKMDGALQPKRAARTEEELQKQQKSAEALAKFLFDTYLKGKLPGETRIFEGRPPQLIK